MGYSCKQCGKVFSAEANWRKHMVFHKTMKSKTRGNNDPFAVIRKGQGYYDNNFMQ